MAKCVACSLFLVVLALASCDTDLRVGLGMRPKRPLHEPEDHRQMVTIDLSALRPTLPGLVLYNYGEQAPKLVQVDLSALNPQLQPHVIWPQFDQMELFNDRSFEFDDIDSIPYLTDDESLISSSSKPLMAKMVASSKEDDSSWPGIEDFNGQDMYAFLIDSGLNNGFRTLQSSLPVADEVIVPLDWEEEKTNRNSAKRAGFLPRGWRRLGAIEPKGAEPMPETGFPNTSQSATNLVTYKREHHWETESDDQDEDNKLIQPGKKNAVVSNGWGPSRQQSSAMAAARRRGSRRKNGNNFQQQSFARSSGQNSWSIPSGYWSVPNFLQGRWQ